VNYAQIPRPSNSDQTFGYMFQANKKVASKFNCKTNFNEDAVRVIVNVTNI
jgi:hypothetical protein